MLCAVVDLATGAVTNVIVAELSDPPYEGTRLVALADDSPVGEGWTEIDGVFAPPGDDA